MMAALFVVAAIFVAVDLASDLREAVFRRRSREVSRLRQAVDAEKAARLRWHERRR